MSEEAPQAAPGGKTAGDWALDALRAQWGDVYLIGYDDERGWWASRRDEIGGLLTAATPDELRALIAADYDMRPVTR